MPRGTPITGEELFEALEEYARASREAEERGDSSPVLSEKTQRIIHSLPCRP